MFTVEKKSTYKLTHTVQIHVVQESAGKKKKSQLDTTCYIHTPYTIHICIYTLCTLYVPHTL